MTYTLPITTTYPQTTCTEVDVGVDSAPITSGFTDPEDDLLSFMETFVFPNLEEVKGSLQKSKYSGEQIREIIKGLKTLPEYERD